MHEVAVSLVNNTNFILISSPYSSGLNAMKRQDHSATTLSSKSVGLQTSTTTESSSAMPAQNADDQSQGKNAEDIPPDGSIALLGSQTQPDITMQSGIALST